MHSLARNRQEIWYAQYTGKSPILDDDGHFTGEYEASYSTPVKMMASVSASRGSSSVNLFGMFTNYQHTVMTCDMDCPITETSVLWIGKTPSEGNFNYSVYQVARGLDNIAYAVKEAKTSDDPVPEPDPGPEPDDNPPSDGGDTFEND